MIPLERRVALSVTVPPSVYTSLKMLSEQTGIPASKIVTALIRSLINAISRKRGEEFIKMVNDFGAEEDRIVIKALIMGVER